MSMSLGASHVDTNQVAIDTAALGKLKRSAGQDPKSALRATAQQFETLFMNMLMKSMRDTLPKDGLLSSSANEMYTGMLDQQLAQKMASRGTGIADMIVKQLSQQMKASDQAGAATRNSQSLAAGTGVITGKQGIGETSGRHVTGAGSIRFESQAALVKRLQGPPGSDAAPADSSPRLAAKNDAPSVFIQTMGGYAKDAERITGVPAKFMLGQAALESGWGRKEISHPDGSSAHNLFGIKAGGAWTGKTVSVTTTEYVGGVPRKMVEKFRAYDSYADSFRDYANLISGSPRYQQVIKQGGSVEGFANAMQRSGYATDPRYAEKLTRTINHMISLRRTDTPAQMQGLIPASAQAPTNPRTQTLLPPRFIAKEI